MFVFKFCSAYTKVAWPSFPGVASCCKGDNCCLPAICLLGMVGYVTEEQRNRLERLLRGLQRILRGLLPADFPSFEALATEADPCTPALSPAKRAHRVWSPPQSTQLCSAGKG